MTLAPGTFAALLSRMPAGGAERRELLVNAASWLLQNDPVYQHDVRNVWAWHQWDQGAHPQSDVALVAERVNGDIVAVCVTDGQSGVREFLEHTSREGFDSSLIITAREDVSTGDLNLIDAQPTPVSVLDRAHLDARGIRWPDDPRQLQPMPQVQLESWAHQREATEAAMLGFASHRRGQVVMASGTGKTLTGQRLAEAMGSERTLVMVPSLGLLAQTLTSWTANDALGFEFLCVCADRSVVGVDPQRERPSELGVPVTTEPAAIAEFLRGAGRRVVFSTYQSAARVAAAHGLGAPAFDLAIADEAHRVAGKRGSAFTAVVDDTRIHAERRLFMTATPRTYARRPGVTPDGEVDVVSMDDVGTFGPVFHELSFGQAIARGLLTDYRVVVLGVDSSTGAAVKGAPRFGGNEDDSMSMGEAAALVGIAKALDDYGLRRVITFHSRIAGARAFSEHLPLIVSQMAEQERPLGVLHANYVSGAMPASRRAELLHQLRDLPVHHRAVLSNARCLTEGADVPALDGVVFVDPRGSQIDVVQAVGRALRRSPDKTQATIVVPVFIHDGAGPDDALMISQFEVVWQVLNALRAHDKPLGQHLDAFRASSRTNSAWPEKVVVAVPPAMTSAFVSAIRTVIVQGATSPVWDGVAHLREFFANPVHSGQQVSWQYVSPDGFALGSWVTNRRSEWRAGTLSAERVVAIEAVAPGFVWSPLDALHDVGLERLREFHADPRHSGQQVPETYVSPDGFKLGVWARTRRSERRSGKLSGERVAAIEAVAPGFVWERVSAIHEAGLQHLREFYADPNNRGQPLAARYVSPDGYPLGTWVASRRGERRAGKLSSARVEAIEAAAPGFVWDPFEVMHEAGLQHLRAFHADPNNAGRQVPSDHVSPDTFTLGRWVAARRRERRAGRLSDERAAAIEAVAPGFVWDPVAATVEDGLNHLREFAADPQNQGRQVPRNHRSPDGYPLGNWVATRRMERRAGILSAERVASIDEAAPGFRWNPRAQQPDLGA